MTTPLSPQTVVDTTQIPIPPPSGAILSLLTHLSNPTPPAHKIALEKRDTLLSTSAQSYGSTCIQFARILHCPNPNQIPQDQLNIWSQCDGGVSVLQLRHDPIGGWSQLREMAGLLLKNALVKPPPNMSLPDETFDEILTILLHGIADENRSVRKVTSSIIASGTVGAVEGKEALPLHRWGENGLTPYLVKGLEDAIAVIEAKHAAPEDKIEHALLGSLQTLSKLFEDSPERFEKGSGPAFQRIVPALVKLLAVCGEERVRTDALTCLVNLIQLMPSSLVAAMNEFFEALSKLGGDPNSSSEVRKLVCRGIVTLLAYRTEYLQFHIIPISQFILKATSDSDPDVSLEACEFWLAFGSLDQSVCTPAMMEAIQSMLPQIIPTLVKGMIYPSDKIQELLALNEEEEQMTADRAQDVAPVFHRTKTKGGRMKDSSAEHAEDSDTDDDDDEDEYDDKEWSLRTCCAASLDVLAALYAPDLILPNLLPALSESLAHTDPWVREAGLLALGAIADGCSKPMGLHMAQLHPFLLTQIKEEGTIPQLKSISCWTLSRYVDWAVEQTASGVQPNLIGIMTEAVLKRLLDTNRKVQIAACSALGVIVESSGDIMIPYLEAVFQTLVQALQTYQTRALIILFDTVGSMADFIGPAVGVGNLPGIYIPALLLVWSNKAKANPFDRTLLPLMESLASISMNIGMRFQPWALQAFDGAMSIINSCMMILSASGEFDEEEADSIICATDLLDGLVEGIGPNFGELVSSSMQYGEHFLSVLRALVGHEVSSVRMSAFALMGDIAKQCPHILQPGMKELLFEAISCIDSSYPSVCNNAVWAIGEVCVKCQGNPAPLQPYHEEIVQNLLCLLMGDKYGEDQNGMPVQGLVENAASTMGRLAKVNPEFVVRDLHRFLSGWCNGMTKISDLTERCDAFEGFILTVQANPDTLKNASENDITSILFAVVSWHIPVGKVSPDLLKGKYAFVPFPESYPELSQRIGLFLHSLKDLIGADCWGDIEKHMPVNVRQLLHDQYHV